MLRKIFILKLKIFILIMQTASAQIHAYAYLKRQPHLMTYNISMSSFLKHTFFSEALLRILQRKAFLTFKNQLTAALHLQSYDKAIIALVA